MSRIKFELTDCLKELLTEKLRGTERQGEIKNALEGIILVPPNTMESYLKDSYITFRRPPTPETEVQRQARVVSEARAYRRMMRRDQPEEWVEARRQFSGAANALLSIVGAAVTVGVLFRKSLGWSLEACVLIAIFTGLVVATAEIFLFGRDVQDAPQ
ncbi:hypothetical protein PSACC_01511 [Paramicrosporidium saccamoebae]|uniref:Uncharacterized protein n=1 Tax=Paramicrosporidium saccamoebae TaxID=1246581 RepID=A0A2H9TLN0_9FUNG|nr:hypothetical protein PSACC_01511 [Paramicrosporidium saccamoebae]